VRALSLLLVLSGLACGSSAPGGSPGAAGASGQAGGQAGGGIAGYAVAGTSGAAGDADAAGGDADGGAMQVDGGGACSAIVQLHPDEGAFHVDCLPEPTYNTNPPSSGNHYAIWADFKTYTTPVPWGHLVHALEHGAVVIVYNCPGGCPDEVAAAQALIDAFPADPLCSSPPTHRLILAPDPHLEAGVRWAASAWTWTIKAPCFYAGAFSAFMHDHYGMGGEDLCGELHEPFCDVPP
jgi:hypothetical protein